MPVQFDSAPALPAITRPAATPAVSAGAAGFGDSLNRLLQAVDQSAGAANAAVGQMVEGTGDVHDAMIALQRAEMTLQLTVQMRNKFLQAYQEIMRMPV